MSFKSFASLMERLASTPESEPGHAAVAFLVQVHERMLALGLSNRALALRMGTSPAYVSRLFHGGANLSVHTMARLALAVDGTLKLDLAVNARPPRPGGQPEPG